MARFRTKKVLSIAQNVCRNVIYPVVIRIKLAFERCRKESTEKSKIIEPHRDKTNKMARAPSEDSDQPGHPPSLIRVFVVRMKKAWMLSYPISAQRRLIRLGGCPGWSESSLGAHAILLVLSCRGSYKRVTWNNTLIVHQPVPLFHFISVN